uniref:Secreted protein n=1 Tax=Lutzomyia longipalpis TaxID=7200 RepID=A0A7G3B4K6_LUTLO
MCLHLILLNFQCSAAIATRLIPSFQLEVAQCSICKVNGYIRIFNNSFCVALNCFFKFSCTKKPISLLLQFSICEICCCVHMFAHFLYFIYFNCPFIYL